MTAETESDKKDAGEGHGFEIVVNGREKVVSQHELTFSEVVALAFDPPPTGENIEITITYRNAAGRRHNGSMIEGDIVKVKHGTVFNVTATDKS